MNNKMKWTELNATIQKGEFQLFLSPKQQKRFDYLSSVLPVSYQRQIREAFYVYCDEEMIASLYQAVPPVLTVQLSTQILLDK